MNDCRIKTAYNIFKCSSSLLLLGKTDMCLKTVRDDEVGRKSQRLPLTLRIFSANGKVTPFILCYLYSIVQWGHPKMNWGHPKMNWGRRKFNFPPSPIRYLGT